MFSTEPLFALLGRAIDTAALRQAVHVANIANADASGYHRLQVQMEASLQPVDAEPSSPLTQARVVRAADDTVRLDQEMALMAKDAVHYQALLGAFERTIGTLKAAIREGREG